MRPVPPSVGRSPVAVQRKDGSQRLPVPVVVCPECAALEPGGFVGARSGDVVVLDAGAFADHRGYAYCQRCFAVWRGVTVLPDGIVDAAATPRSLFALERLGLSPGFDPHDADNVALFKRLARTHHKGLARADERLLDRVNDAITLSNLLELPYAVREAVVFHVEFLNTRADLRSLCNTVRAEAVTMATVALVMERFDVYRDDPVGRMVAAMRDRNGRPLATPDDYKTAYHACDAWFAAHLWRDGS